MANTPHPTAERIHQVARRLFVKRSYSDVTMDEIAVKAQITKGALYHHFKSKEALYLAMMEADLSEKQVLFNKAVTTVMTTTISSPLVQWVTSLRHSTMTVWEDLETGRMSSSQTTIHSALDSGIQRTELESMLPM